MENTDSERSRVCPTWKPEETGISRALLRTRSTFSKSVMVSVAVSLLGATELIVGVTWVVSSFVMFFGMLVSVLW